MKRFLLLAAAFAASPVAGQEAPRLTLEQATMARCSATFALLDGGQGQDDAFLSTYPSLGERGREFFVRTGAQLMDELQLTREQLVALLEGEIVKLVDDANRSGDKEAYFDSVLQPCLLMLDASGI